MNKQKYFILYDQDNESVKALNLIAPRANIFFNTSIQKSQIPFSQRKSSIGISRVGIIKSGLQELPMLFHNSWKIIAKR